MFICLYSPDWKRSALLDPTLCASLIKIAPRIFVNETANLIWADARSLNAPLLAESLWDVLIQSGIAAPAAGIAQTAIAAEVAGRKAASQSVRETNTIVVKPGDDRSFLGAEHITALNPSPQLLALLEGVGIESCADLAKLTHESVEIRFGVEGVHLWRLSRADDRRRIFAPMLRGLPSSSYEWVDYTLTDPERLIFIINALVGKVCEALAANGQCAREITLVFSLANRSSYEHLVRPARSTASHKAWMRLIRTHLERLELPDGVTGMSVRVESVTPESERQGDIFDRGFATARVTEETIAELLDDQGAVVVVPENSRHPLIDRRTEWQKQEPARAHGRFQFSEHFVSSAGLTLQVLSEPRRISVDTANRRDHVLPVAYSDEAGWVLVESAAGPDRVSGAHWQDDSYAREYFRCVTSEGRLVWIYRNARDDDWYLHGWWD